MNRLSVAYFRVSFAALGFYAEEASTGEQALALLAVCRFDVVLLDVEMPGIQVFCERSCHDEPSFVELTPNIGEVVFLELIGGLLRQLLFRSLEKDDGS
jgi:CheY-like chemotaxis protein